MILQKTRKDKIIIFYTKILGCFYDSLSRLYAQEWEFLCRGMGKSPCVIVYVFGLPFVFHLGLLCGIANGHYA